MPLAFQYHGGCLLAWLKPYFLGEKLWVKYRMGSCNIDSQVTDRKSNQATDDTSYIDI